jgi:hypothetical protein
MDVDFCAMGVLPPARLLFRHIVITGLVCGLSSPVGAFCAQSQGRLLVSKFCL